MARTKERVVALVGAIVFLTTSLGLSFAVVFQMIQDGRNKNNSSQSENTSKTKLAGTQLQSFTPVAKIDALQTVDTTPGTGQEVKAGDTVTVDYTGAVAATGKIFQSSLDSGQPIPLTLAQGSVIDGWVEGIPGMKVGGTRRLLIPAAKAYAANPPQGSNIPANADLVFDVTVKAIGGK